VTASIDGTARIWDVSRSVAMAGQFGVVLTAALARGIGWRTNPGRADLLRAICPFARGLKKLAAKDRP